MRLLILGGTGFLGRYLVEAARLHRHEVAVFSRGWREALPPFDDLEQLHGDRDGNLESLRGRSWDAVIDACGFRPAQVKATMELLCEAVAHYTFISSVAVYEDFSATEIDERAPVKLLPEGIETLMGETYGPLKARCEMVAERRMPGRVLNIRPGVLVGPHDPTDRFTYWVHRVAQGGEVAAPDRPERRVQFIDVRNLSTWLMQMVESSQVGTYNTVGPAEVLSMGQLLEECREVSGSAATFNWISEEILLRNRVIPFTEMPFWVRKRFAGLFAIDSRKAFAAGLRLHPTRVTIQDTFEWCGLRPPLTKWLAGLDQSRERALLEQAGQTPLRVPHGEEQLDSGPTTH